MSLVGLLSSGWARSFIPETNSEVLFSYKSGPKFQVSTQNDITVQSRRGNFNSESKTIPSNFASLPSHYSPWASSTSITGVYIVDQNTGSPYWSGIDQRGSDLAELTPSGKPINDSLFSYKTDTGPYYKTKSRINPYTNFLDGSGDSDYQVNYGWQSSGELNSNAGVLIDFESLPLNVFGQSKSLSFTNIKKISITSQTIDVGLGVQFDTPVNNVSGLEVGGGRVLSMGGSNPMFSIFGSGCHLGTNGIIDIQNPETGWPVTENSTMISMYNSSPAPSHYEISILGTSESGVV